MTDAQRQTFTLRTAIILAGLVLGGLAISYLLRTVTDRAEDLSTRAFAERILNDDDHPLGGNPAGDVTIIVFTDYACPICRISDPEMERAAAEDGNTRIIYRLWPVIGPQSGPAARMALAADAQGLFAGFHGELSGSSSLSPLALRSALERAGGDWEEALSYVETGGDAIEMQIEQTRRDAFQLGLQGTPAYLVGPYLFRGKTGRAEFARAIRRARKKDAEPGA